MQTQLLWMQEAKSFWRAADKSLAPKCCRILIALALLCSVLGTIPPATADSYPASIHWSYYYNGWQNWHATSADAAQEAFTAWALPVYVINPSKQDWFFEGCSSKTFIDRGQGQFNYVYALLSTPSSINGLWCENTGIALSYYYYCPNGGEISYLYVDQCINVPPCQTPLTRDQKTGACILSCQPPDVIDPATGQCVKCPIDALKPLPQDACTLALENLSSTQAQKDAACGKLSQAMEDGKACLEKKLASLGTPIPLSVGVGVRSDGYQKHFREIWDKMEDVVEEMESNPIMRLACAARRAEIAAEKGCNNAGRCVGACTQAGRNHCLRGRPSSSNTAPHTLGNAIDVSESRTIAPLRQLLKTRKPPQEIQQFLDEVPDCKLIWGGTFKDNYDPIHFQVR
jgi:hypothetical protein